MVGELLQAIKDAEAKAAKIISDAHKKATKVQHDAEVQMDKIKFDAEDFVAKEKSSVANAKRTLVIEDLPELEIPKDRIDKAIKHIQTQFHKRYT